MKECLAERLRQARKDRGLTLRGLAAKSNISHSFLADIESGRSMPSVETLDRLAEILNVPTDYLLGRTLAQGPVATAATHREDGYETELPPEALKSIEEFKEFIRRKHRKGRGDTDKG